MYVLNKHFSTQLKLKIEWVRHAINDNSIENRSLCQKVGALSQRFGFLHYC